MLNSSVLRRCLNDVGNGTAFSDDGREFRACAATTGNACVDRWVNGATRVDIVADLRQKPRHSAVSCRISMRYGLSGTLIAIWAYCCFVLYNYHVMDYIIDHSCFALHPVHVSVLPVDVCTLYVIMFSATPCRCILSLLPVDLCTLYVIVFSATPCSCILSLLPVALCTLCVIMFSATLCGWISTVVRWSTSAVCWWPPSIVWCQQPTRSPRLFT